MVARILVTGISGFVGGAFGAWLRRHCDVEVTGISRTPPREGACHRFIQHDLALPLPDDLPSFDGIVHGAALASPWGRLSAYQHANLRTLESIIEFAHRRQPRSFVFISSSAVHYAYRDQLGIAEDMPWPGRPVNFYALTKREGEAMVRASGLPWTIVRPRAVFGAGDTVVFPRILHAARQGQLPRLRRADGSKAIADLLHIDNLCFYLWRILEDDVRGLFLLTNNQPVETERLLLEILAALGLPAPRREVPVAVAMAAAGVMEAYARWARNWREPAATRFGVASLAYSKTFDVSRAIASLGAPPVSIDEGMRSFIAWQKPRLG